MSQLSRPKRLASVYEKKGRLYARSCARTTTGLWIDHGVVATMASDAPKAELGEVVERAIRDSVFGVAHPDPRQVSVPLLAAAGARTFGAFARGAKLVKVSEDETGIAVVPTRNGGSSAGFVDLPERTRLLPAACPSAALGAAIREALRDAE